MTSSNRTKLAFEPQVMMFTAPSKSPSLLIAAVFFLASCSYFQKSSEKTAEESSVSIEGPKEIALPADALEGGNSQESLSSEGEQDAQEQKNAELVLGGEENKDKMIISRRDVFTGDENDKDSGSGFLSFVGLGSNENEYYKMELLFYERGKWQYDKAPKPGFLPVYLVKTLDDEVVQKTLAYHGWDLNFDGQIDMLEGYDLKGRKYIHFFDFDFDGKIDVTKRLDAADSKTSH